MISNQKILFLLAILLAPIIPMNPASAEQASFTQQILPMDCVFQVVNVGTGTIVYLTPAACGVIIPPAQNPLPPNPIGPTIHITPSTASLPPVKTSSFYGYEYYEPSPLAPSSPMQTSCTVNAKLPLLNNYSGFKSSSGQILRIKVNQAFCFQAGNNPASRKGAYVLTVLAIDKSGVTIDVGYPEKPTQVLGVRALKITRGQTVEVDLSGDKRPDLAFELLNSASADQANIKVWQPKLANKKISISMSPTKNHGAVIWPYFLAAAAAAVILVFVVRRRRKRPRPISKKR